MTLDQPVNNHDDMRKVTDNVLCDAGMTAFGEFTRAASQVEMSKTPQFWDDALLYMQGSGQPVWMPANQPARV